MIVGPHQLPPATGSPSVCPLMPHLLPLASSSGHRRRPQDRTYPAAVAPNVSQVSAASSPSLLPQLRRRRCPVRVSGRLCPQAPPTSLQPLRSLFFGQTVIGYGRLRYWLVLQLFIVVIAVKHRRRPPSSCASHSSLEVPHCCFAPLVLLVLPPSLSLDYRAPAAAANTASAVLTAAPVAAAAPVSAAAPTDALVCCPCRSRCSR